MKTSFSRTFATAVTILLLTLLTLGASFQALVKEYLTETTFEDLKKDARVISDLAAAYSLDGSLSSRDFLLNLDVASQVSDADTVICNAAGTVVLCSDALMGCEHQGLSVNRDYLQKVLENGGDTATGIIQGLYSEARYVVSLPILDAAGTTASGIVIVSVPTAGSGAIMQRIVRIYFSAAIIVGLVFMAVMSLATRHESQPLRHMAKVANAFAHGDLDARVKISPDHSQELQELALAFNNMASTLQKGEYQRQEFVANVSHELKTPMTTISGYIDGILDGTIPAERSRHYLQIVSDETKRLSRLVRSMLDISRLQDQQYPEDKKMHFDLEECAGRVLITFEQKIVGKGLDVDVDMPMHPVYTIAVQDAVTQVIYNLIDNAVKFCPQGGTLGLKIKEGGGKVYVSVSNTGETIPPEELPLLFDRFHKADKSRSVDREGVGLGLYIVKTILNSHGEDISVTSREGVTTFQFTLPLVR